MQDLYSLSQIIKAHSLYSLHRDLIHALYRTLARQKALNTEALLMGLRQQLPELAEALKSVGGLYGKVHEETQRLRQQGLHFVIYGEELFPSSCYWMQEPPLTLSYIGEPVWQGGRNLAVVGSRDATDMSLVWMEREFANFCEQSRACIISGGARGLDQKAHAVALRKGCPTIVVLPSGLGNLYPRSFQAWVQPVLQGGGCLISEYAYQQPMHKSLFHHRNRFIAALGSSTLVVEARRRSGSLITAQQALQMGRAVATLPGHPLDPHFGGSLDLLSEGAFLVRDAQDLLMFFSSELRTEKEGLAALVFEDKNTH